MVEQQNQSVRYILELILFALQISTNYEYFEIVVDVYGRKRKYLKF